MRPRDSPLLQSARLPGTSEGNGHIGFPYCIERFLRKSVYPWLAVANSEFVARYRRAVPPSARPADLDYWIPGPALAPTTAKPVSPEASSRTPTETR